jgi:hypothetical protein
MPMVFSGSPDASKAGFISVDPLMGIPRHAFIGRRIVAAMTCCTPESKNRL